MLGIERARFAERLDRAFHVAEVHLEDACKIEPEREGVGRAAQRIDSP